MKAALIGLGMVSQTHLRAFCDAADVVELAGVCARTPETAQSFAQDAQTRLGYMPKVYASVQDIADDPTIDFAVICTPPDARLAYAQTLAAAGKHILMEKPIERDHRAATQIVDICENAGITLGIVLQHRMRAASVELAQVLRDGILGAVAMVEVSVPWWRDQSYYDEPGRGTYARDGGGVLISQAIHTLDLALSLLGPVTQVRAMTQTTALHNMESEDFAQAALTFASGAVGSVFCSTACFPGHPEKITLHCELASATLTSGTLTVHWRDGRIETRGEVQSTGGGADPMAFTHGWHTSILIDFVDALLRGRAPVATGREALQAQRLIDAMVTSSRTDQTLHLSSET